MPKITWSSREPGGKETKQSHDLGASAILQPRDSTQHGWDVKKTVMQKKRPVNRVTTSCQQESDSVFDIQHERAYTLLTVMCMCGVRRKNPPPTLTPIAHPAFCRKSDPAGALAHPFHTGIRRQPCAEHFIDCNLHKSDRHVALLSPSPRVRDRETLSIRK